MKLKNTPLTALVASMAMAASGHAATPITTDGFNVGVAIDNWDHSATWTQGQWSLSQTASGGGRVVVGNPMGYGGQPAAPQEGTGQAQFSNGGNAGFTAASITDTAGHSFNAGDQVTMLFYLAGRAGGTAAATINVSLVGPETISLGSFTPTQGNNAWVLTTSNTAAITTAGTYNVQFSYGNAADDVDRTTFLDSVSYSVDGPPTSGTWTNTAGGLWDTAGNWTGGIVATGNGSTADLNALDITADTAVDLDSPRTVGKLVFGDTDTASAAGWTLANNGNPANILTLSDTTPTITVNALGATKTATISAEVAGTAGFVKSGDGTLILTASNPYTGATTVSDGTLQVSGQPYFNIGRTTSIASGAVFELANSVNAFTSLMPVSTITGAGTFRLSGNSTIDQSLNGVTGTRLTIDMQAGGLIDLLDTSRLTNGGWQVLNWTTNQASMNIASGATLDVWDGQDVIIDALTGSGTVDKVHGGNSPRLLKVGVANGSGAFSGTITNTGGQLALIKTGTGTQTLSGPNTYTGNTSVEDGTLSIAPGGSLRFRPTTYGLSNSLSGTASATLSYLGTVDFDLSAAEKLDGNLWSIVDVGSFNASTLTPAAVTSTLGNFIETPVDSGTWELSTAVDKWTFTEGDGLLLYEVTATPYELWANSFDPVIGLPAADDDNDGVTNFEEYAFGLAPNSGASVNPITTSLDKTTGTFTYTRRAPEISGLDYNVHTSETLQENSWGNPLDPGTAYSEEILSTVNNVQTVKVTLIPAPTATKLFIQVRAN